MREIKFRAWDVANKKMISHEKLFSLDCSNEFPFLPLLKNMYSENLDVEIMQYTGMKDCNGTEIYEGDIVVVGYDTGKKYDRYVMTFNDDSHAYLAKQQGTLGSYIGPGYWNDKLMVIGNCWDNPELLGGVHDEH